MAGETVEVTDDSVVTIELPEDFNPEGAPPKKQDGAAAPASPTIAPAPAPAPAPAGDDAAAALQQSLENERRMRLAAEQRATNEARARADAEQRAQQREQEATEARTGAVASQMRETVNGLDAAKRSMQAARAAHTAAHEAGDAVKLADAQEAMSFAAADIRKFEAKKIELEEQVARAAAEPDKTAAPATPAYTDPVEAYLSHPSFSPAARDWLRQHREFLPPNVGGSAEKNAAMMQGHHLALGQGYAIDTPDYYRVIEEKVGIRQPVSVAARTTPAGGNGTAQEGTPQQQRREAIPSARPTNEPASPSGAPNVTRGTRSLSLTKDMQEMALISYPQKQGEDERAWRQRAFGTYAYHYVEAAKEGKIGRTTH